MGLFHRVQASKVGILAASMALVLTACGNSDSTADASASATPSAEPGVAGPNAYTTEQKAYLDNIKNADLAASVFLSATDYLTISDTVCTGLKNDITLDEILTALASSGKENGLNENQRTEFSLYTSAAAVTYICPDQKDKYKRDS
ncbi:MAG: hypothetical protein RI895_873 [Actinomycetota bacterium]|jgi:hypothetical protein